MGRFEAPGFLSPVAFPVLEELFQVYAELEERMARFGKVSGIACPDRCCSCCETAKFVECFPLEMVPLSLHLWQTGKAEFILEKLTRVEPEGPCVLLDRNSSSFSRGSCTYYSFRPLVCRLFGFSAVPDKYGNPKIALCKPVKHFNPDLEEVMNGMIREGLQVPVTPQLCCRVAMLQPGPGQQPGSINGSLRNALENMGYRMEVQKDSPTSQPGQRFIPLPGRRRID